MRSKLVVMFYPCVMEIYPYIICSKLLVIDKNTILNLAGCI